MARKRTIYYDVVIGVEDYMRWGNKELSAYIYTVKHVDGSKTIINLDKNFLKIQLDNGEITLKFRDSYDMLLFAEALYNAVLDLIIDHEFSIERKLGSFLQREQEWLQLRQQYEKVIP